jgi:hypothetical protein
MRYEKIIICAVLSTAGPFNDECSIATDVLELTRKWVEFNFLCVPDFELVCKMSVVPRYYAAHIGIYLQTFRDSIDKTASVKLPNDAV